MPKHAHEPSQSQHKRGHLRRWWPLWAPGLFALAACNPARSAEDSLSTTQDLPWVTVAVAALDAEAPAPLVHGVVVPPAATRLAFEVAGRLAERSVATGAEVAEGQALGQLESEPYRHGLAAARAEVRRQEAQRDQARREARRARALGDRGALTPAAAEAADAALAASEAGVQAARAQVAEAERRLARTTLRAPFAGRVVATHADAGALLEAGGALLTLHAAGAAEVALDLTGAQAARLKLGDRATVRVGDLTLPAAVVELAAASGPAQLTAARLRLAPDAAVRAGDAVLVRLPAPEHAALVVPLRALADPSGHDPWVLRVRDGQVERVPVRVGPLRADAIALESGLAPGDVVVTSHLLSLRPGQAVRVQR